MTIPEMPRLTEEQMQAILKEIAILREQPGKEQETLRKIRGVRPRTIESTLHPYAADLYWEECLVAKHMLMNDDNDPLARPLFRTAAIAADAYIEKHNIEGKRPRSQRFLGDAAMAEGDYEEALTCFRLGIQLYEKEKNPAERVNILEFKGFLAEALIRSGEKEEGLKMGFRVFTDFDKAEGAQLKEMDYYTWAVWKSGAAVKMWNAVLDGDVRLIKAESTTLLKNLNEAERIINVPRDEKMPSNFEIRKDQIAKIKRRLANVPK